MLHPYFADLLQKLGFGSPPVALPEQEFGFEQQMYSLDEMRSEFMKEILYFHPEAAPGPALAPRTSGKEIAESFSSAERGGMGPVAPNSTPDVDAMYAQQREPARRHFSGATFGEDNMGRGNVHR